MAALSVIMKRIYTKEDISIVSVDSHLKRNQEMYFGSRGANPEAIATAITEGALVLGARRTLVAHEKGWWYACADIDWLKVPTHKKVDESSVFETIWAFPEAGVNFFRSEVFARVFSDRTFAADQDAIVRIKGELPTNEELRKQISILGSWHRVIAFEFNKDAA